MFPCRRRSLRIRRRSCLRNGAALIHRMQGRMRTDPRRTWILPGRCHKSLRIHRLRSFCWCSRGYRSSPGPDRCSNRIGGRSRARRQGVQGSCQERRSCSRSPRPHDRRGPARRTRQHSPQSLRRAPRRSPVRSRRVPSPRVPRPPRRRKRGGRRCLRGCQVVGECRLAGECRHSTRHRNPCEEHRRSRRTGGRRRLRAVSGRSSHLSRMERAHRRFVRSGRMGALHIRGGRD
jgi:hypothetical protein